MRIATVFKIGFPMLMIVAILSVRAPPSNLVNAIPQPLGLAARDLFPNVNFTTTVTSNFTKSITVISNVTSKTTMTTTETESLSFTNTVTTTSTVAILPTDTGAYGITAAAIIALIVVAVFALRKRHVPTPGPLGPAPAMVLCPSCKTQNRATATFCRRCRTRLH